MNAAAPDDAPSSWIVSPRFDLSFFVLPALGSLVLGALAGRLALPDGSTPDWAWLLLVVGIDVAHVHATTMRTYLDGWELRRRPALYALAPAVGLGASVLLCSISLALFWRALAYVAVWHFVRQQIGWLRLYRRRAGEPGGFDRFLDEAAIYAATLYPLVAWHARLTEAPSPHEIRWFVPGDFLVGVPPWTATAARAAWLLVLGAFALRQVQRLARGGPVSTGKVLLVATTAATWWAGIVLWRSDFAFTVTNVVAHGLPYMAVSQRVGSPRPPTGTAPPPRLAALFAPGRLPLYLLVLAALAFAEEWLWDRLVWADRPSLFGGLPGFAEVGQVGEAWLPLVVPLLALPQLTHYILDGYVWRVNGDNPGLREALGIAPPPQRRQMPG